MIKFLKIQISTSIYYIKYEQRYNVYTDYTRGPDILSSVL